MIPYADLVTLLLMLFVVLFVASQDGRGEQAAASLGESFGRTESSRQAQLLAQAQARTAASFEPPDSGGLECSALASPEQALTLPPHPLSEISAQIAAFVSFEGLEHKVSTRLERRGLVVSLVEAGLF